MQTIVYQCDTAMPAQKLPNCCIEQMEEIHKRTIEKEALDNASLFKAKIYFIASILLLFLLAIVCYMLFFK